jgi:sialidase-1
MPRRLLLALLGIAVLWPSAAQGGETVFVANGEAKLVREEGRWKRGDGFLEGGGYHTFLYAGKGIGAGDFRVTVRLEIRKLAKSAASFVIGGRSHFGFEGGTGQTFVEGPFFRGHEKFLGPSSKFVPGDKLIRFEMVREGTTVRSLVDGQEVIAVKGRGGPLGMVGLRPHRSTMRVHDFRMVGNAVPLPPPRTQPDSYTIPTIDLSGEPERQVVVARGTQDLYQGHVHTLLMPDNKTLYAVWTIGHGGHCGPMKKSTDGGLTWSDLLPTPKNWTAIRNCPTIHRLTAPDGTARLFVFAGNGAMYQSVSEDGGKTWTPMRTNGLHCIVAPITILPIDGGTRYLMHYHRGPNDRDRSPLTIWQSTSDDGGLTWSKERKVGQFQGADPCEPALIRSPDGSQLASIARENRRRYNSLIMFSSDEGKTWSKMRETPAAQTGDRHMPHYAPDGRLVMTLRDTCKGSPTRGDFVAWVGTYADLAGGREGQYRVRLLNSPRKGDLGYSGLELLPDGTFAATTYAVLEKGEKNSIVSVRFSLDEIDERAKMLPRESTVFTSGQDGYHTYRIPAVVVSPKGDLLAFCEGRKKGRGDSGNIDIVMKRSTDGGASWSEMTVIADQGPNAIGNPCPVVDQSTGTIWMPLTRNRGDESEGQIMKGTTKEPRTVWLMKSTDDGRTWTEPVNISDQARRDHWPWYATGPGVGIQLDRGEHKGRLLIPCDHSDHDYGGHPYRSHAIFSDDGGETWHISGAIGQKTNECQAVQLTDGRVLMNMRSYHGKHRRAIARSSDGGATWGEVTLDEELIEPVCQASILRYTAPPAHARSRILFSNPASTGRNKMTIRLSYDEGETWPVSKLLYGGSAAYSCLVVLPDHSIGCLYEKDGYSRIVFARFTLAWLTDGKDELKGKE